MQPPSRGVCGFKNISRVPRAWCSAEWIGHPRVNATNEQGEDLASARGTAHRVYTTARSAHGSPAIVLAERQAHNGGLDVDHGEFLGRKNQYVCSLICRRGTSVLAK